MSFVYSNLFTRLVLEERYSLGLGFSYIPIQLVSMHHQGMVQLVRHRMVPKVHLLECFEPQDHR